MAEFKLSARAEADLLEIYDYTNSTFGTYQADAYHAGLERTFDLLANFPRIGASVDDIAPGHRRFRFQAHIVFYTEDRDGVVIRAIMHHSREIRPDLFD
ncbi:MULTISPECIES: type II toxin-antitoxin system RelE/ParE family toxin [unclassified Bradyrhizobium]|uniref:type II toxin-antitoxin system RelE/ParE family toxin n=1 Tax=unclassified Bradyrhizobium TaxID=2631580 RepID=UPI0028E3756E|nr:MULTISPECIES: type II toxin-antitoxin system RelE/ParE family toxin [unclassified Bradyrhizobium]